MAYLLLISLRFIQSFRAQWHVGSGGSEAQKIPAGKITIKGQGATIPDNAYLSLIARTIDIHGPINGGHLILEAGKGPHDANDTLANLPLAIDVSALGGMYAQSITLISNDQGAGVNLSNLRVHAQFKFLMLIYVK